MNGEERGRTPSTLARLALDAPVRIRLVKDGWKSYEKTINWDDGTERRHRDIHVTLKSVERDPPAVVPAAKPAPARARKRRRARRRPARRTRRPVRRTRPRPAPRPRGFGKLNVMTSPWAAIYVDGRKVSPESPLLGHRLSEGSHRVYVCFRNDPQNCASPRTVTIRANESSKVIFKQ